MILTKTSRRAAGLAFAILLACLAAVLIDSVQRPSRLQVERQFQFPDLKSISSTSLDGNSRQLLLVDWGGAVEVLNLSTGEREPIAQLSGNGTCGCWINGNELLVGDGNGEVWRFDRTTKECLSNGKLFQSLVAAMAVVNERTIAFGNRNDSEVTLTNPNFDVLERLRGHSSGIWTIAVSRDRSRLATAGHDRSIRIWDARPFQPLAVLTGHTQHVIDLSFIDNETIVSVGEDRTLRTWDVRAAKQLQMIEASKSFLTHVAYCKQRGLIASADGDGGIQLWRSHDLGEVVRIEAYPQTPVVGLSFTDDGSRLISSSCGYTTQERKRTSEVTIWRLPDER